MTDAVTEAIVKCMQASRHDYDNAVNTVMRAQDRRIAELEAELAEANDTIWQLEKLLGISV